MSELKPCPFCGGEAGMIPRLRADGEKEHPTTPAWVVCDQCHVQTKPYNTLEEAIEAWNTRHEQSCKAEPHSNGWKHCSVCKQVLPIVGENPRYNYCPNCGGRIISD